MSAYKFAGIAVALTICGSAALSNPLKDAERELSNVVEDPKVLEATANSKTMKAARTMCLITADAALKQNPGAEKHYSEIVAHCAMGNLHHALGLLGNTDEIYKTDVKAKVPEMDITRHFTKWEHTAIKTWDKIK
jgi:hypothetical protein